MRPRADKGPHLAGPVICHSAADGILAANVCSSKLITWTSPPESSPDAALFSSQHQLLPLLHFLSFHFMSSTIFQPPGWTLAPWIVRRTVLADDCKCCTAVDTKRDILAPCLLQRSRLSNVSAVAIHFHATQKSRVGRCLGFRWLLPRCPLLIPDSCSAVTSVPASMFTFGQSMNMWALLAVLGHVPLPPRLPASNPCYAYLASLVLPFLSSSSFFRLDLATRALPTVLGQMSCLTTDTLHMP